MAIAGVAKLVLGSDEEAVTRFRRAIELNRNHPRTYFLLVAGLAQLNRLDEAQSMVQAGLALNPTFILRRYRAGAISDNPTYLAQVERFFEGMRKAGLPAG